MPPPRRSAPESARTPVRAAYRRSVGPTGRLLRAVLAVAVSTAVCLTLAVSSASADDLDDRRAELKSQLAKTRSDLSESSSSLRRAALAVDRTESALAGARAALARTRAQLAAASALDQKMAAKLATARAALARAKAAVVVAESRLAAQQVKAGQIVRDQYQRQTNLIPIAMLLQSRSTTDLQTRLQWSTTLFDTTAREINRLTVLKRQLEIARSKATALERQVAADRAAAAANLKKTKALEQQAATQESSVARLLDERRALERSAAAAVEADKRQYAQLNSEAASVERRIAARIAAAKAAAARKAAAERAAAERARIAAAKAAARAKAKAKAARAAKARAARERAEREERQARAEARRAAERADRAREKADRSSGGSSSRTSGSRSNRSSSSSKSGRDRQQTSARKKSSNSSGSSESSGGGRSASHGFIYPVNGSISSPYGMRFHPILHYWKLHDGTDFGASCGTRIKAAYSGRVAERYFNAGYGNRLMIDHGEIDGRYVTTGYNHASRYIVRVGQHVTKGQTIGYVGSTGYATGCHLHLMVWLDGNRTNPMNWF